ncbi:uncharacterized protein LOC128202404 [Galleria mellonella]|uniref:Uncharacterized protein LOC128202404 n=1 Tax=Galleria mellonella TaxID=7137 RepID=A0ABM3N4V9_GALME|nr:uncharacterized protein LOC128202404 [Galleria mellonella]
MVQAYFSKQNQKLLKEYGHEVLSLPPYNCDLNPIEHIWNLIKQRVADKNVEQYESKIKGLTMAVIASITPYDWKKQINHIKRFEQKFWSREVTNEHELNDFIIQINPESDNSDDSQSSCSEGEEDVDMGVTPLSDDDPCEGTSSCG